MTIAAKSAEIVHMTKQSGERRVREDGGIVSTRTSEALVCGEEIKTSIPNEDGDMVVYEDGKEILVGKLGTRLTDRLEDVTCSVCLQQLN